MGLRINTNIASLSAQRHLSDQATEQRRSLDRLSSGNRIERAGDDAAGLAQSRLTRCRQHPDGQVAPRRTSDAGPETRWPARRQLGEFDSARENDYPARHFTLTDPLQRPAKHHPAAAQRASIRILRLSDQPTFWSPSLNAATQACPSWLFSGSVISTPMRRKFCCARATSGHAATAPPRSVMNSRRWD